MSWSNIQDLIADMLYATKLISHKEDLVSIRPKGSKEELIELTVTVKKHQEGKTFIYNG